MRIALSRALSPKIALPALAVATMGAMAVLPGTAQAAPASLDGCPTGQACGFASANFAGGHIGVTSPNAVANFADNGSGGDCVAGRTAAADDTNGSWNDCISSVANAASSTAFWYKNEGCGTFLLQTIAGGAANVSSGSNDAITAMRFGSMGSC